MRDVLAVGIECTTSLNLPDMSFASQLSQHAAACRGSPHTKFDGTAHHTPEGLDVSPLQCTVHKFIWLGLYSAFRFPLQAEAAVYPAVMMDHKQQGLPHSIFNNMPRRLRTSMMSWPVG